MKKIEQLPNKKKDARSKYNNGTKGRVNNNRNKKNKRKAVANKSKVILKKKKDCKNVAEKRKNKNEEKITKMPTISENIKHKNDTLKRNMKKKVSVNVDFPTEQKKKHPKVDIDEENLVTKKLKTDNSNSTTEDIKKMKKSEKVKQPSNVAQDSNKIITRSKSIFFQKKKTAKDERIESDKYKRGSSYGSKLHTVVNKKNAKELKENKKHIIAESFSEKEKNTIKKNKTKCNKKVLKKEKETPIMENQENKNTQLISKKKSKKISDVEDNILSKKKVKLSNEDEEKSIQFPKNISNVKEGQKNKKTKNENKETKEGKEKAEKIKKEVATLEDTKNEKEKKKGKEKKKEKEEEIETSDKPNVKMTFEVTNRFAVLGCDWDNISSVDVFYLFESYYNFEKEKKKKFDYSKSKAVKKVTIYTSKYGEKKLKYEEEHGPAFDFEYLKHKRKDRDALYRENNFYDLINEDKDAKEEKKTKKKKIKKSRKKAKGLNEDSEDNMSNDENNEEKAGEETIRSNRNKGMLQLYKDAKDEEENERIRLYQLQRSRYYFALVECYNKEIVEFLYEELNDMDADFCINYLDLRIIDDNCSLDDYKIKESCEKIPLNYKLYYSVSSTLKHSNTKSLWDENPKRKRFLSTKFTEEELRELDMKEYLADTESEEDIEEDDTSKELMLKEKKEKHEKIAEHYRNLLLGDLIDNKKELNVEKYLEKTKSNVKNTMNKNTPTKSTNKHLENKNISFSFDEMNELPSSKRSSKYMKAKETVNRNHASNVLRKSNADSDVELKNEEEEGEEENEDDEEEEEVAEEEEEEEEEKEKEADEEEVEEEKEENEEEEEEEEEEKKEEEEEEGEMANAFKNLLKTNEKREDTKSPWENFLEKTKMKKKRRRKAYLELKRKRNEEIKNIIRTKPGKVKNENKRKNKNEIEHTTKINTALNDERFSDLFKNKNFNIDITNPRFKKTKFIEKVLQKKA